MRSLLLFGGTTEGRYLAEALAAVNQEMPSSLHLVVCVATAYGETLIPQGKGITVLTGRKNREDIGTLLRQTKYDCVIDATHPYAGVVTDNIRDACRDGDVPYLRLLRPPSQTERSCVFVSCTEDAVAYLNQTHAPILLTTGSKDLEKFSQVKNYRNRLFVRILPTAEALAKCAALDIPGRQIICMQGPFSEEMNLATLHQTGAKILVTKESGAPGGFLQKVESAWKSGTITLVIGRPPQTEGASYETIKNRLKEDFDICIPSSCPVADIKETVEESTVLSPEKINASGRRFPLFISLEKRPVVVFGGGTIALRRIKCLLKFGCVLTMVTPWAVPELAALADTKALLWKKRCYAPGDVMGATIAVAATDTREVNRSIGLECASLGIPVSVADRREECTFYFPGIALSGDAVVGICAGGGDHSLARHLTHDLGKQLQQYVELYREPLLFEKEASSHETKK